MVVRAVSNRLEVGEGEGGSGSGAGGNKLGSVKDTRLPVMAPLPQLQSSFKKQYRTMVSLGGITKTAKTEIRMTASGFYGAVLQHPGVETAMSQRNKLLMHYGRDNSVGNEFQISIELFFTVNWRVISTLKIAD